MDHGGIPITDTDQAKVDTQCKQKRTNRTRRQRAQTQRTRGDLNSTKVTRRKHKTCLSPDLVRTP